MLGLFFHFLGHIFGPLIVWLVKRGESAEIDAHGKESLNFQLSMLIYDAVAAILCLVLIGFPILILLWVLNTVFVIIASVKASEGQLYRYPLTIGSSISRVSQSETSTGTARARAASAYFQRLRAGLSLWAFPALWEFCGNAGRA